MVKDSWGTLQCFTSAMHFVSELTFLGRMWSGQQHAKIFPKVFKNNQIENHKVVTLDS